MSQHIDPLHQKVDVTINVYDLNYYQLNILRPSLLNL